MHQSIAVANLYKIHDCGGGVPGSMSPPSHGRSSYGGRKLSEIPLGELNQAKPIATLGFWVSGPQREH